MCHPQDKVKDVIAETEGNVCIIDGSLLAFRSSAAGEKRSIVATHRASGNTKPFDNRTALKAFIKERNIKFDEDKQFNVTDFEIEDVVDAPAKELAFHNAKSMIQYICGMCNATEYRVFLDEGETFRHHLATSQRYKGNRIGKAKPVNLKAVKEYLVLHHAAEMVTEIEADDLLNMYQWEGAKLTRAGSDRKIISCSFDKDSWGNCGWLFDFRKDSDGQPMMREPQWVDGLGKLILHPNKVSGDGRKFFYYQVLDQDSADNYKGRRLSGHRYSHKRAYEDLSPCKTDKECIQVLVNKYQEWYPEELPYVSWDGKDMVATWESMLQEHWDLARMLRWRGDEVKVMDVIKRVGAVYG